MRTPPPVKWRKQRLWLGRPLARGRPVTEWYARAGGYTLSVFSIPGRRFRWVAERMRGRPLPTGSATTATLDGARNAAVRFARRYSADNRARHIASGA